MSSDSSDIPKPPHKTVAPHPPDSPAAGPGGPGEAPLLLRWAGALGGDIADELRGMVGRGDEERG